MAEETLKIDLGTHTLRARSTGSGEPVFVLVHGFADGMDVWNPVAGELAQRGRVVAVELRGHGYSTGPEGPYEWDDLGGDLVGVLESLGIGRAILVGHGLGGLACLLATIRAPERVERLVLLGTATEADAEQENWCREVVKAGRMNALQGIAHAVYGPMSRKTIDGIAAPLIELARLMQTLREKPLTPRMTAITRPVRLLAGENDPARTQALAEAIPGATLEVLAGHGHFPHKKDPAAVVAAILRP